eukprot:SAG22_NODE_264_length_13353_cov_34.575298_8_plen_198_part_00
MGRKIGPWTGQVLVRTSGRVHSACRAAKHCLQTVLAPLVATARLGGNAARRLRGAAGLPAHRVLGIEAQQGLAEVPMARAARQAGRRRPGHRRPRGRRESVRGGAVRGRRPGRDALLQAVRGHRSATGCRVGGEQRRAPRRRSSPRYHDVLACQWFQIMYRYRTKSTISQVQMAAGRREPDPPWGQNPTSLSPSSPC